MSRKVTILADYHERKVKKRKRKTFVTFENLRRAKDSMPFRNHMNWRWQRRLRKALEDYKSATVKIHGRIQRYAKANGTDHGLQVSISSIEVVEGELR